MEAYYKAPKIGRQAQHVLKSTGGMSTIEINDILFYVIYAVIAAKLEKRELVFQDLAELNLHAIPDEYIVHVAGKIYNKYKQLGGNSKVAKSSIFIGEVYGLFGL